MLYKPRKRRRNNLQTCCLNFNTQIIGKVCSLQRVPYVSASLRICVQTLTHRPLSETKVDDITLILFLGKLKNQEYFLKVN